MNYLWFYMAACALFSAGYLLGAMLNNPDRWA